MIKFLIFNNFKTCKDFTFVVAAIAPNLGFSSFIRRIIAIGIEVVSSDIDFGIG
jgi:hypothetical protein